MLLAVLCWGWIASVAGVAKVVPVPGQGMSFTIPDDWIVLVRPDTALVAATPDEGTAMGVVVSDNKDQVHVDTPKAVSVMAGEYLAKARQEGTSIKVIDARILRLDGVPAGFVQTEELFPGNRVVYRRAYKLAANAKIYLITLDSRDALDDPVLGQIAGSLHFDHPPETPDSSFFIRRRLEEIAFVLMGFGFVVWGIRKLWIRLDRDRA